MGKKAGFFQFRLKGVQAQRKRFKEAIKATKKVIRKATREAAKVVQAEAIALAPKKTGTLKKGIVVRAGKAIKGAVRAIVTFSKDAWYGRLVEKGHKKRGGGMVPAKPFIRPAFDAKHQEAAQVIINAVKNELKQI